MAHYLAISGGQISFRAANPSAVPVLFEFEEDAADAVAVVIMETGVTGFAYSSSCFHPADEGRPAFDLDAFFDLISEKLAGYGVEMEEK